MALALALASRRLRPTTWGQGIMTHYWCVNFDSEPCLQRGIGKKLWLMQYQYADDDGNEFQDGKRAAISRNWKQLANIKADDWFVAYLPQNRTETRNPFY